MNTITHNQTLRRLLLGALGLAVAFAFVSIAAPTAEAKDATIEKSRITITINQPTGSYKEGKLTTRESGESSTPRLKIMPIETDDGRIRIIVPTEDLVEGENTISIPARLLDSRSEASDTGGKLQAR